MNILDVYIKDRVREDMGDIDEMVNDFLENGQITAITVRPATPEEKASGVKEPWVLVAGGRRMAAAMRLGWMEIEAFAREEMDQIKHRELELNENLKRKDMTPQEIARAKEEIFALRRLRDPKITATEVAVSIGDSPATFSRDLEAAKALREMPELEKAQSRKAILRGAKMASHIKTREAQSEGLKTASDSLKDLVVTADMLDWLPRIDESSVDLMIPDLPYGINFFKQGMKESSNGKDGPKGVSEYDDTEEATAELFERAIPLMIRATKKTGWMMLFGSAESSPILHQLLEANGLTPEVIDWIWYRPNSRNASRFPEKHAQNVYEHIVVCNMGGGVLKQPCSNVLVFDAVYSEDRIHVNQKPVELYEELIQRVTFHGELVCDPCFGSGASLAAAVKQNRRIIGCDKNPAMLKQAHGHIMKHHQGIAPTHHVVDPSATKTRLASLLQSV